jgi:hypothetical protein
LQAVDFQLSSLDVQTISMRKYMFLGKWGVRSSANV